MICAPSNNAVDEIITRIITSGLYLLDNVDKPRIVRVGVLEKNPSTLIKSVSLEH